MFVAWLKPPWQQITPYIADRRFCAPKMKRNGAKKGRKGGRVKVEKKMTVKKGTMGGGEGVRGEGVGRMWGGVDRAVRPHAALNHARTFFTFRSFNGALLEGLPLWGWRRDFSRSPSGNSRNTTNGSFHPYLRPFVWIAFPISSRDSPLLPPTPPPPSLILESNYFQTIFTLSTGLLAAPAGISRFSVLAVFSWDRLYRRKLELLSDRI